MAGASPFVGTGGGWVVDAGASCLSWGRVSPLLACHLNLDHGVGAGLPQPSADLSARIPVGFGPIN